MFLSKTIWWYLDIAKWDQTNLRLDMKSTWQQSSSALFLSLLSVTSLGLYLTVLSSIWLMWSSGNNLWDSFIQIHSSQLIFRCGEHFTPPSWFLCLASFNNFALIFNASVNFIVYCVVGDKFKMVFNQIWNKSVKLELGVTVDV